MAKMLSGVGWVSRFPTSTSPDDLVDPFRSNAKRFISALRAAGANVAISATLRPPQRAFLMHWSYQVANAGHDPDKVPVMAGVEIEWMHKDARGNKSVPISRANAAQMVAGYRIAYAPALTSRHSEGKAIDMTISWTSVELKIKNAAGTDVTIKSGSRNGDNPDLHKVGATYTVVKLVSDPPHWSSDGH